MSASTDVTPMIAYPPAGDFTTATLDYVAELGNTSAASIPLALSLAQDDGRLPAAGHVLLTAFGAGFSWGAALLTYGGDPQ